MRDTEITQALTVLARHKAELAARSAAIDEKRRATLAGIAADWEQAQQAHAAALQQRDETLSSVRELAAGVGVTSPSALPPNADLHPPAVGMRRARLASAWAAIFMIDAAEQHEQDQARRRLPGRIIQWCWLGVLVLGTALTLVLPWLVVTR